jgi:hypothetical protein
MGEFMNKQELIDNAVHELKGVLPKDCSPKELGGYGVCMNVLCRPDLPMDHRYVCTKEEFQQRARELGYVNGYRWGVEYPTNGSKPDLPDDVIIQLSAPMCRGALSVFAGSAMYAAKGATFKITDERYKPEDASYLDEYFAVQGIDQQKIKNTLISDIAEQGWFDYTNQKALRLPPVGVECEYEDSPEVKHYSKCTILAVLNEAFAFSRPDYKNTIFTGNLRTHVLRPLDWNRKAEAERKRVVDAVFEFTYDEDKDYPTWNELAALYDAGFLRMPEDK